MTTPDPKQIEKIQKQLDAGTKETARNAKRAIAGAEYMCSIGDDVTAAQAWEVAGHLCLAMAAGRRIDSIAGPRPKLGGK